MARPKERSPRTAVANVRLTPLERAEMARAASEAGLPTVSEYVRFLHRRWLQDRPTPDDQRSLNWPPPREFARTVRGVIYRGDSRALSSGWLEPRSVDLIMTSPPFGLVRKKSYGNEDADRYCEWFRPFAHGFRRVLKESGSLVIDIGGAWKPGIPTRSLYHFELLAMLCREFGFHLCQEHFWWNPSKLPTPAEWVNIRRVRVKDAVNCVWWLSLTPWPKADNRRILSPYSEAMRGLLRNGYTPKLRPSGHNISTKFQRDNGGAVPPNLLAIANTESNGRYQAYCKAHGLRAHPARFPHGLPEYFIRMLTDKGDLVLDPFAGSCVTGEVAESLERRWVCVDADTEFLEGARGRFPVEDGGRSAQAARAYAIYPPCSLRIDEAAPLPDHGGQVRLLSRVNGAARR